MKATSFFRALALASFALSSKLTALDLGMDFMLTNGFRDDQITSLIEARVPSLHIADNNHLKIKTLKFYQVGLKGNWDICQFRTRLDGNYGWSTRGNYKEKVSPVHTHRNSSSGNEFDSSAWVKDGHAQDLTVGAGYAFCVPGRYEIEVAPMGGWSYHHTEVKMHHGRFEEDSNHSSSSESSSSSSFFESSSSSDSSSLWSSSSSSSSSSGSGERDLNPVLDGLEYRNRWEGPWVGVDIRADLCPIIIRAGYEYHWGSWHATWKLAGLDVQPTSFSDRRHSKHVSGNVFYLDARYTLCDLWVVGAGFKYQHWDARHGRVEPLAGRFAEIGAPQDTEEKVKRAKWCSFAATLDLGITF